MLYSRIDKLDYQLRSLQAQHQVAETENLKRSNLLEQTTMALSLLENENTKLQKVTRYILALCILGNFNVVACSFLQSKLF